MVYVTSFSFISTLVFEYQFQGTELFISDDQMSSRTSSQTMERLRTTRLCETIPPAVLVALDLLHLTLSNLWTISWRWGTSLSWLELRFVGAHKNHLHYIYIYFFNDNIHSFAINPLIAENYGGI